MKKYWLLLKMSFGRELQYRTNLIFGRLRNFMILLMLFFVFIKLSETTGRFAGYTETEILTYIMGVNIIRGIVFGGQSRQMASEINEGVFSKYLTMPIKHFLYQFFYEAGQRLINIFFAFWEATILGIVFRIDFYWQLNIKFLGLFFIAVFFALMIYYLLSYIVNMLAFWSREAMGPRFLFEWILEFASGAIFPLNILAHAVFSVLAYLPFFYIIFFPISVYLGRLNLTQIAYGLSYQIFFIFLFAYLAKNIWQNGLKKYSGEGM